MKEKLEELRQNRQFLSTHGVIRNFNKDISLTNILKDIDDCDISSITQKRLNELGNLINVDWKYCIEYYIKGRKGQFFYGFSDKNELINYHRKETRSAASGQTLIHVGKKDLQVTKLLGINRRIKSDDFECMFNLSDIVNNLELEKRFFQFRIRKKILSIPIRRIKWIRKS